MWEISNWAGNAKGRRNNLKKRILALATSVLVVLAVLIVPMLVLAGDNEASQSASTSKSAAISIVGKVADTAITTITFPEGAPDATVSDPWNNVDGDTDKQVLHASTSEPVVKLKNTSGGSLKVWLEITTWSDGVAASEDYELVDTGTTTVAVVDDVLSSDGNAASVDTTVTIAAAAYKALYLELVLSSSSGASGTSTLSVLGES